jgi:general stress protein 26
MEWSDVAPHLTGIAQLATVRPDGSAHVAVVSPSVDGEVLWIGVERSSATARNVAANPTAALVWTPGAEAYVWADVEVVDDVDTKRRLWDGAWGYDPAGFFGTPDNPQYLLLRLVPRRATVLTATDEGLQRLRWTA